MKNMVIFLVIGIALAALPGWAEEERSVDKVVDINTLACKEVIGGSDRDREIALGFYHGYMAGKKKSNTINLIAMSDISDKVKDYCLSNPNHTIMEAFIKFSK